MNAPRLLARRIASLGGAVALVAAVIGGSAAVVTAGPAAASGTITQGIPTSGTVVTGNAFTDQLSTTGQVGPVTFFTDSALCEPVTVSSTGMVNAPDTIPPGSYVVFGHDSDGSSDTGIWSFTLTVTGTGNSVTQGTPFSGTVTQGNPFTDQLTTTNGASPVTFSVTSPPPGITVSTSGHISAVDTLVAGPYSLSGTDTDSCSNTGTWSYTLTVTPHVVTQGTPFSGTVTQGNPFTDQLTTTNGASPVTFSVTSPPPGITVSTSGQISAVDTVVVGPYSLSGTDTDSLGNTGTWMYTLTVTPHVVTQGAPFSGTVTQGNPFTDQLTTTNGASPVTFSVTSPPPGITVSTSGHISAVDTLVVGPYSLSGTDTDSLGNTGTWSYTLTVTPHVVTQGAPFSGTVTQGNPFTDQLTTTNGASPVTFSVTSPPPGITVSTSGHISAVDTLVVGPYSLSGTDTDSLGNTGTWMYTLTVTPHVVTQGAPFSGTVTQGNPFTDQLTTTNGASPVTFSVTSPPPGITVSTSGHISAVDTLVVGPYSLSGTDTDSLGNTGTWMYTLTVTPHVVTQGAPFSGTVTQGNPFTDQLTTTNGASPVTFSVTSPPPGITVSTSGHISAVDTLVVGPYSLSGTDTDSLGNTGTWSYTLTVIHHVVTQGAPFSGTVTQGNPFTDQLTTTNGASPVTFSVTSPPPGITVSTSGHISAVDTLVVGPYSLSGTDTDSLGNTGTWSYTLTVTPHVVTQGAPFSGTVTQGNPFTDQLTTTNGASPVTFSVTSPPPGITVSTSGHISAVDTLVVGPYSLSGTDTDSLGNTGTWMYTLTVNAVPGPTSGYWLVASDGGIFSYGNATYHGSTGALSLNKPIVGMAATPNGKGYWLVASDGGVFAFGDAVYYGSTGGLTLNKPIVGMAATPDGKGYWLVASDGGIFAFGDAVFHGSTGNITLNKPIVGMAASADGKGYWLVASDGGIFAFGDAVFHGSTGNITLNKPIVGMAATPDGKGYWLVASDGGIFAFGDAVFHGSTGNITLNKPIVGMAATPDGKGYWLVASDGGIFAFGDAVFEGSSGGITLNQPVVGMST